MSLGPSWIAYSLITVVIGFGLIIVNIWRHSKKEGDTPGLLFIQNFIIAVASCAVLFWYWGILPAPKSLSVASSPSTELDCGSVAQRREVDAIKLCLKAKACDVTVADALTVVTFRDVCVAKAQAKAEAEKYKYGCTFFNPVLGREQSLSEEQCWELDATGLFPRPLQSPDPGDGGAAHR